MPSARYDRGFAQMVSESKVPLEQRRAAWDKVFSEGGDLLSIESHAPEVLDPMLGRLSGHFYYQVRTDLTFTHLKLIGRTTWVMRNGELKLGQSTFFRTDN